MPFTNKPKKNTLSIRLTESAVFLRSDYSHSRRNNVPNSFTRDGVLRGLLVLDLAKPTKITSIAVDLTAITTTACPEGMGSRRVEVTEQHRVFHASTTFFHASARSQNLSASVPHRRSVSIGPGVSYEQTWQHDALEDEDSWEDLSRTSFPNSTDNRGSLTRSTPSRTRSPGIFPRSFSRERIRQLSIDGTRRPSSRPIPTAPTPPYSPLPLLDEQLSYASPNTSFASSVLRRGASFTETILEDEPGFASRRGAPDTLDPGTSASFSHSGPTMIAAHSEQQQSPGDQQRGRHISRAPNVKRLSLSAVSNIFFDVVGSVSSGSERQRAEPIGRNSVSLTSGPQERGRPTERSERVTISPRDSTLEDEHRDVKEHTSVLSKILGDREEWSQEFKGGTYTYPITFIIPASVPPTIQAEYGSVTWKLNAFVHRPGTFHSKLSAEREVVVVTCPTEEDTEDSENIVVERNWEQQLQYLISISGRAFFIGGTVPISLVLMPLDKVKVYRIAVYIEERVEYFSRFQRLVRSEPPVRLSLLSIKHEGKISPPILPLASSTESFLDSPLSELINHDQRHDEEGLGELAASFMGPGPWSFHKNLKLPSSCQLMKFSNKNLKANVRVVHLLKIVLRVEKASHPLTVHERKQLVDIIVQTPVLILSCRCNPAWVALPRYTEVFEDTAQDVTPNCPCKAREQSSSHSAGSSAVSLPSETAVNVAHLTPLFTSMSFPPTHTYPHISQPASSESIVQSSSLFERLVSGQESETGEAPPAYDMSGCRGSALPLSATCKQKDTVMAE